MFSGPAVTGSPGAWPSAYADPGRRGAPPRFFREGRPYASGKAALASALRSLDLPEGSTVLLPALVPHRLPEAVRAAGASVAFYRVRPDLRPDLDDLADRVDDETAALVGVQYFGFPQPAFGALRQVADEEGLVFVDDSSHGALSEHEGRPLGTFGDVGFTSLHKLLPVPNGALLYGDAGDDVRDWSVAGSYTAADARFAALAAVRAVQERWPAGGRLLGMPITAVGLASDALGRGGPDGEATPEWDGAMSRLTLAYLRRMDRGRIVSRRRDRYHEWLAVLDGVDGADPLYESLPQGVCPWMCPVTCTDPVGFRSTLRATVAGAFTWPTLPRGVDPRTYPTATRLSRSLLLLPVHQGIPADRIRTLSLPPCGPD